MSRLIDPATGRPMQSSQPILSQQDLLKILTVQDHKIDVLNGMHMQLAFWVEYIAEKLQSINGVDGEPLFVMDVEEFQAFAEARWKEVKAEAEAQQNAASKQQAAELLESVQQVYADSAPEIKLDE